MYKTKVNMSSLFNGVVWNSFSTGSSMLFKFITIPILARTLTPEDFGVVALCMTIILFFSFLGGNGGISAALIAKANANRLFWSSALITNVLIGTLLSFIVFYFSSSITSFLGSGNASKYLAVLSIMLPFQFAVDILASKAISNFDFKLEAKVNLVSDVAGGICALILALNGFGAWAIVAQNIIVVGLKFIIFMIVYINFFIFYVSINKIKSLLNFSVVSVWVEISNAITFQSPIFVSSKFDSIASSGYISVYSRIAALPCDIILTAISKVLYPLFSNFKKSEDSIFSFKCSIWVNSIVLIPILLFISANSEYISYVLLGENFSEYWTVLLFITLCRAIMIPTSIFNPFLKASGKISLLSKLFFLRSFLTVALSIPFTIYLGIDGLLYSLFITTVISFVFYVTKVCSALNIKLKVFFKIINPAFISGGVIFLLTYIPVYVVDLSPTLSFIISFVLSFISYFIVLFLYYPLLIKVRDIDSMKHFFLKCKDFN